MNSERIPFTGQSSITIEWNDDRKASLGQFPVIETWFTVDGETKKADVEVIADAPPPDTTLFTLNFGGPSTGFTIIK